MHIHKIISIFVLIKRKLLKNMVKNIRVVQSILYLSLLAFISFVAYILYINQEVLYAAHNHSEFLLGSTFFQSLVSRPFGIMQYAGAWFTQLFHVPMVGAGVLVAIWALIFVVGKKAFRLQGASIGLMLITVACLLTSIVDLGYWIYVSPIRGYWFSQSLAYLLMLVLLWGANFTPRQWHIVWYLIGIVLYPVLGWYSLLFVLCLAISQKPGWWELIGIILMLCTASIWRALIYSNMNLESVMMAGLPRFVTASDKTDSLTTPFWVLGAISLLIPLCSKYLNKWYVPVLSAVAGIVFTLSFMYYDANYIDEMRMVRYAEQDNWKEVLEIADKTETPTTSIIMLKNLALMNEGGLLSRSFSKGYEGTSIHNPDSVHTSFLEISAPLVYYNYGMLNEGFRISFECAVQSGFSPFYLKMLARCAHANGEDNLARRYISQLSGLPFYSDWKPATPSEKICELHGAYQDEITGVENTDGYIVNSISLWYESDSKLASEQALLYSMIRRDSKRFWASFRKFIKLHMDEEFPVHVQEAYIMYMDKAPEEKRVMLPVSQEIYDRYKEFWTVLEGYLRSGASRDEVPEKMRKDFGDTYWYYNIFARRVY